MAKVTLGPLVTDARGTTGSTVFLRNHQGACTRTWKKPHNPNTAQQALIRQWEKAISKAWWQSLTENQREGWAQKAQTLVHKNTLGQHFPPQPNNLYTQRSMLATIAGGAAIPDAPQDVNPTPPGAITLTANSATQELILTPTNALPSGCGIIVRSTKNLSPGIYNFKKWLRSILAPQTTLFSDNFPNTNPVPPWTAAPTYVPANWTEAANTLSAGLCTPDQHIYITEPINDYVLTFSMQFVAPPAPTPIAIARVDPTTGAHYLLYLVPSLNALYLVWQTDWTGASSTTLATFPFTAYDNAYHTWSWSLYGPNHLVQFDGTPVLTANYSILLTGPPGLQAAAAQWNLQNLSLTSWPPMLPTLPDISINWLAKFGPLVATKKIGVELRYVNLSTGEATIPVTAYATVT